MPARLPTYTRGPPRVPRGYPGAPRGTPGASPGGRQSDAAKAAYVPPEPYGKKSSKQGSSARPSTGEGWAEQELWQTFTAVKVWQSESWAGGGAN